MGTKQYAESFLVATESLKARAENSPGKCIVVQLVCNMHSSEMHSVYQQDLGHTHPLHSLFGSSGDYQQGSSNPVADTHSVLSALCMVFEQKFLNDSRELLFSLQ